MDLRRIRFFFVVVAVALFCFFLIFFWHKLSISMLGQMGERRDSYGKVRVQQDMVFLNVWLLAMCVARPRIVAL